MTKQNLSFIKTAKRFKYSVNIKFDLNDFQKIDSYIPTAKNIQLFREIFESFPKDSVSRAHLLMGAYGTGKSLFAMVLGTLLSNKDNPENYNNLISNIAKFDSQLANRMEKEITEKDPYLLVLPTTNNDSFKQNMLSSLEEALAANGLEDIFPETHFKSVINKLEQWQVEYSSTYERFKKVLQNELGLTITDFKEQIEAFDQENYNFFVEHYPDLTSGGNFNSFYGCDLNEIYSEVSREIRKQGYQGIYILYDEFNKLLEDNIDAFDGKVLQDFAEMTTRSDENEVHLLLISHKNLVQYTTNLSQDQVDEWKKIEGRFKELDITQYSSQIFELMSNVILKEEKPWETFKDNYQPEFDFYERKLEELNLYPNYNQEEKEEYILEGCYPLHPLTTALLPKLSQKVAQNERTIFTYLSTDEQNTLGEFLNKSHSNNFPLVYLSSIYDYFEELMKQEFDYTQVHQAWADSQRALQKVSSGEEDKINFIKSLGVIYAVNNFTEFSPSKEMLGFALDYLNDDEFENLINGLIEDKIILYRKSLEQFKFFEGSDIDFRRKINEKRVERSTNFSGKYLLNDYFKPSPVIPKKYNDLYKIRRYFVTEYLYLEELKQIDNWEEYLVKYEEKSYIDGAIAYLLLNSKEEIEEAVEILNNISPEETRRIIFVVPKKPVGIDDLLRDFDAQLLLKKDKEFLAKDSLAEQELNLYIEETKQLIDNRLNKFIEPQHNNAHYYYNNEIDFDINSRRRLCEKVSDICLRVFNKTPKINNELIIKNRITAPQRAARKEVVESLMFNDLKERLGISGYGPSFLIYRTIFIKTNLLQKVDEDLGVMKFNSELSNNESNKEVDSDKVNSNKQLTISPLKEQEAINYKLDSNLKEIMKILQKSYQSDKKQNIGEIYDRLRRPPYGLRLGVMPILLMTAGRINDDLKNVAIRHNDEEREINVKLFEDINKYPARFTLERIAWDETKEEYITFLEKLFSNRLKDDNSKEVNRLKKIYISIKEWYQALPKYARETKMISKDSLKLSKIINRRTSEIQKVLLEVMPKKLIGSNLASENIDDLEEIIYDFVKEHNQAYSQLVTRLQIEICDEFTENCNQGFKASLSSWYQSLEEQTKNYTYSREINAFLNILRKLQISEMNEEQLLKELAVTLTGFDIKDWDDNIEDDFLNSIQEIKGEVEGHKITTDIEKESTYEFALVDVDGQKYERNFKEVELEGLAQILENKVKSSFEDIGNAVSDQEKQQILVNLLKMMFE
ncbi:hypothetical protein [Selenihalanaerobacter shriftii]|uniref:Uncharacterized protein n=1 Tax=Selenihalanaerobacter shriftii TaxID=142842 RepID=A0A1T4NEJ7_9FIRM|nr:hypothetical protein [Selenihalanaerobacter shriftii]SJZ77689.1 hypothetical protein SAMN02745118_01786 [Selenihalanaerobacter shriftii]